ncbi:MAG: hypothetical protein ACFFAO_05970 [Candidatus Hermodarchaeota archaeon]
MRWIRDQLLKTIRDQIAELLVKQKWPLLDVTSGAYTEEIEEDVLPLIEEFSIDEILKGFDPNIGDTLEAISKLLEEHRVEVKYKVSNKTVLTPKSGDSIELENTLLIQKKEEELLVNYELHSGFTNPVDDIIEEAIMTDLIPYNFEIVKIELNGEIYEELPNKSLKREGLEVEWHLQEIKPKEEVEINYNLRRRISRSIIFVLKDQLKIIKTHSKMNSLALEGLFEALIPFKNPYNDILKDLIIEDIIPLYYLHIIKEPKQLLPPIKSESANGALVKWNIGNFEEQTINYHYKLLELYKYEEIKIKLHELTNKGITLLDNNEIDNSLTKFIDVKNSLKEYI